MEIVLGFAIALAIALTGVGAGSLTTPLLLLLTGISPAKSVGTALAFGFLVKCISTPVYLVRRQVDYRVLRFLLFGGVPGVLIGSLLLDRLQRSARHDLINLSLGLLIAATAIFHLYRMSRQRPIRLLVIAQDICLTSLSQLALRWDSLLQEPVH